MWANCWWLSRRWSESCLPSWPQTPRIIRPSDRGWMYDKWMQIKMIKTNRITAETIETGRVQSTSGQETEPNFFCSCHSYLHHTGETGSYLHHWWDWELSAPHWWWEGRMLIGDFWTTKPLEKLSFKNKMQKLEDWLSITNHYYQNSWCDHDEQCVE